MGGQIYMQWEVQEIEHSGKGEVAAVVARNSDTGSCHGFKADYFFSTMPIQEMVSALKPLAPARIREIADGLVYRAFITVGVLCNRLQLSNSSGAPATDKLDLYSGM